MSPDEPKIKLGTVVRPDPNSATGEPQHIQLGPARPMSAPVKEPLAASHSSSHQQTESGFSLEAHRKQDSADRQEQAKRKEPMVRPSILIAACAAGLLLLMVGVFGPKRTTGLGMNNAAVLRQYKDYWANKKNSQLPSAETVGQELNAIAQLENAGRAAESKHAWEQLVIETQSNKDNPIYTLAVKRLKDSR